jgi:transcriptional regulator with XRE-family HTH domain
MAFHPAIEYHARAMSKRTAELLAELKAWCDQERGRWSEVARVLGVSRGTLADWYNPERRKSPTAEQALAIQEFLRAQRRRRRPDPPAS